MEQAPQVEQMEPEDRPGLRLRVKMRITQAAPFLGRYLELAAPAACCGACPTCVGTAASGLLIPVIQGKLQRDEGLPRDDA
jgi:hypothetical protein